MLVMKFPPGTSLPSAAELKARFVRFGALDQSGTRVFWKSSTCRVVFRYKVDAQAACKYANGNNTLFGNVKVRYSLRDFEASTNEVGDSDKSRGDDASNETPRSKDPIVEREREINISISISCAGNNPAEVHFEESNRRRGRAGKQRW
ncbi:hypothetical protein Dsin_024144 [Dipteronia sinensis]|uniref:Uncharacterized protein n=1 Tax=Dipteronia sinensis TaxID=43782 RepID=A0AAE0A674_9ROSI|nr:hypothetical protein Dsin_024144 [Dipteronia sinensis]